MFSYKHCSYVVFVQFKKLFYSLRRVAILIWLCIDDFTFEAFFRALDQYFQNCVAIVLYDACYWPLHILYKTNILVLVIY